MNTTVHALTFFLVQSRLSNSVCLTVPEAGIVNPEAGTEGDIEVSPGEGRLIRAKALTKKGEEVLKHFREEICGTLSN